MRYKNCQCLLFVREVIVLASLSHGQLLIANGEWAMANGQMISYRISCRIAPCSI
ncbi:hypothetical protein BCIN_11g03340 [Botrytis cinerea B05.10]|uniref:Uncharacterized protein n=1 Tax=Botryotinia fuckeliana (strain B05.10) TaxID=332648 RepID=A0A384JWW7_BOTFB|nr:hypothetical protein BCIN_11g03340 [Botrytis cinerea B05.10]ATZ55028.1 hypothetical protein BCIN_11g03340 [Botrytis cinerea B05.10]